MKKKGISIFIVMSLLISMIIDNNHKFLIGQNEKNEDFSNNDSSYSFVMDNEEMVTKMLIDNGTIKKDQNILEKHKIFEEYTKKSKENQVDVNYVTNEEKQARKNFTKKNKSKNKKSIMNLKKQEEGTKVTDKILVVLVDFPDLKFNTLKNTDTYFYYPDYNKEHYQKLLFSKDGYKGPNSEDFKSMRQYYNIQSNNTYDIDGQVVGTYTADNNAAYYGADDTKNNKRDINTKQLLKEVLVKLSKDPSVNLSEFDKKSIEEINLDRNEPDKILDHIIIVHAGLGQEYGGGILKTDAISSHSSKIYDSDGVSPYKIEGTEYSAYKYCIQPEDGTVGVFAHEYAHDLGYHDEYDTKFNTGDAVSWWSIMSRGEWAGLIPGTEPVGFSPYAKEFFQGKYGDGWYNPYVVSSQELYNKPTEITLDQASIKGENKSAIKLKLPDKVTTVNTPFSGKYEYWSGCGNNINSSMVSTVDLTNCSSAKLTFKTWYSIEQNFDSAHIKVKSENEDWWSILPGNITVTNSNVADGITGESNGWEDANFDLSKYCGKNVQISFNYNTDSTTFKDGFYVDDIKVETDKGIVLSDDCESNSNIELNKFIKNDGNKFTEHYYLLEWRNDTGIDTGLSNIKSISDKIQYDTGLVIWYIDKSYDNNWTGSPKNGGHPGYGYIGVIDAEQNPIVINVGKEVPAPAEVQMHDAAFSLKKPSNINIQVPNSTAKIYDKGTAIHPIFKDNESYFNKNIPTSGRILTQYGVNIEVKYESDDRSLATIELLKKD